jgi:hypothetical protein
VDDNDHWLASLSPTPDPQLLIGKMDPNTSPPRDQAHGASQEPSDLSPSFQPTMSAYRQGPYVVCHFPELDAGIY